MKFQNGQFSSSENKKTSNNIIEVINGKYVRGQMDKKTLGGGSKGFIQRIYNDYDFHSSEKFIDDLQAIVTEYMKLSSYSVGINDLIANNITNQKIIDTIGAKKAIYNLIDQLHISAFENNTVKTNKIEFETQTNSILKGAADEAGSIVENNYRR